MNQISLLKYFFLTTINALLSEYIKVFPNKKLSELSNNSQLLIYVFTLTVIRNHIMNKWVKWCIVESSSSFLFGIDFRKLLQISKCVIKSSERSYNFLKEMRALFGPFLNFTQPLTTVAGKGKAKVILKNEPFPKISKTANDMWYNRS